MSSDFPIAAAASPDAKKRASGATALSEPAPSSDTLFLRA
jgi:hypothetical protein